MYVRRYILYCYNFHFSLAGISRSVTLTAAYLVTVAGLNHQEALQAVRASRTVANPNIGFQRQLHEFENGSMDKVGTLSRHLLRSDFALFSSSSLIIRSQNIFPQKIFFFAYFWKVSDTIIISGEKTSCREISQPQRFGPLRLSSLLVSFPLNIVFQMSSILLTSGGKVATTSTRVVALIST